MNPGQKVDGQNVEKGSQTDRPLPIDLFSMFCLLTFCPSTFCPSTFCPLVFRPLTFCPDATMNIHIKYLFYLTADCQPGTYVDPADSQACLPCARGSYTNAKWQTTCMSCGTGLTTLSEGADSGDMCISKCHYYYMTKWNEAVWLVES